MNQALLVDGSEYISASRASKMFGYAQDYIGSLVRTGKVEGKMVGRAWYIDLNSLLEHRKNRNQNKGRKKKVFVNSAPLISAILPEEAHEVHSDAPSPFYNFYFYVKPVSLALCSVLVVIAGVASAPYIPNVPQTASAILATIASHPEPAAAVVGAQQHNGIVITPNTDNHAAVVEKTKNAFSDDVNVTFDNDGNSGVVTPVFHDGDDTEHYTFVLVPVKPSPTQPTTP